MVYIDANRNLHMYIYLLKTGLWSGLATVLLPFSCRKNKRIDIKLLKIHGSCQIQTIRRNNIVKALHKLMLHDKLYVY